MSVQVRVGKSRSKRVLQVSLVVIGVGVCAFFLGRLSLKSDDGVPKEPSVPAVAIGQLSAPVSRTMERASESARSVELLTPHNKGVLFEDDFEKGATDKWDLESGWTVIREGQNSVLSGSERKWARLRNGRDWTDYVLRFRMKLVRGPGVHLNYRVSKAGRYYLGFGEHGALLRREAPLGTSVELTGYSALYEYGRWYEVQLRAAGPAVQFSVDGTTCLNHTDGTPLLQGNIGFETLDGSEVHFDDVRVLRLDTKSTEPTALDTTGVATTRRSISTDEGPGQQGLAARQDWTALFQDDFDSGNADLWELESGWTVVLNDGNFVLSGSGRRWAKLRGEHEWTDYRATFRMKIVRGGVHLVYRLGRTGRYYLGFGELGAVLRKEAPWGTQQEQAGYSGHCPLGVWHRIELEVTGGHVRFSVDGRVTLDYTDPEPLVRGPIAFETLDDSQVLFDDVVVVGEKPVQTISWSKLCGPLGGLGYDVRIDPVNPNVMYVTDNYAGVAKSTDGGNTWVETNQGITARSGPSGDAIPIFCLTIDPHDHNALWAGAKDVRGIFKSVDAGKTWRRKDRGIVEATGITLRSFTIDPKDAQVVYCGAEIATGEQGLEVERVKGKIYRTADGGENWSAIWAGDSLVRHIIVDPADSNVLYAATGIFDREAYNSDLLNGKRGGLGILKTTDGGASWRQINNGLGNLYIGYLTMAPADHRTLYAATGNYPEARLDAHSGLFVTHDAGDSWSQLLAELYFPFTVVRISTQNPNVVYAGTEKSIFRSRDGGTKWDEFGKGDNTFGPPGVRAGIPIDLTIDPRDSDHIYVNNYLGGVFQSHDGGKTWRDSSKGYSGAELRDLAQSSSEPNRLYVVGRSGPFQSADGGRSWEGIRYPEILGVAEWYAIEASPNKETLLLTDDGRGIVFRSTSGGRNWHEVFHHPAGLGDIGKRHGFKALRFAPSDPNVIYAGMCFTLIVINYQRRNDPSYGVYVSRDGGRTWQEKNTGLRGASALNIHDIAVHPQRPGTAYAATHDSGVFMTTDFGETWVQRIDGFVPRPPNLSVRALAIDPHNPERIFAGVEDAGIYVSMNAGENWSDISLGMDPWASIRSIAIHPKDPGIVVAGDWHSGIYYLLPGGGPWRPANAGLSTRAVTSLLFSADGSVLYAATDGGGVYVCSLEARS